MQETIGGWVMGTVLPGLGTALVVALISVAREWVKGLKDERVRQALTALVEAAEQLYGPGKGEAKRRFVRERLKQRGLGQVTREDVEAAVYGMNNGR